MRDALFFETEGFTVLRARRNFNFSFAVERGYVNLITESSLGKIYRQLVKNIIFMPFKNLVWKNGYIEIEIAR